VAICTQVTFVLWSQVLQKLDTLSVAASDDAQFTLNQMELEFVLFLNAALLAGEAAGEEELIELRRRFDIFYSRVQILGNGQIYRPLAARPEVQPALSRVEAFLAAKVPLIDGTDDILRSNLPAIRSGGHELKGDIRAINIAGVTYFAAYASERRSEISRLMSGVAVVTVILFLSLLGFALVLVALNRIARRRAEELAMSGERLSTILATALDAVIVADASGEVSEYNAAAERIFGWRRDTATSRLMTDVMMPDEGSGQVPWAASAAGAPPAASGRYQLHARRANGSLFPAEVSITRAPAPDGEMIVAFVRDISQRVANEQALREARDRALDGERAKARFLAVMSHEMRTPLNGLLGSLELLEGSRLDSVQRKHLAILRLSGELLLHHVNDVLDISRLDAAAHSFARDPLDPAALLAEVAEIKRAVAAEGGNVIELEVPPEAERPILLGDARRLRQALLNLLGNAVKFTHNGRITLAFTVGPEDADGLRVEFRVTDTGFGIAPEDQSRIFEDFVTLDATYGRTEEGTGLGLPITRRLVTAMGGEIGVDSGLGQGSSFWFRLSLPVDRSRPAAPPAAALPSAPAPDVSGSSRHVLLIEDNEVNRAILRAFLGKLGHTFDEAFDGDEGVRLATLTRYDVILTDISMPCVSGVEATRLIRAGNGASRDTPIIAVTAHALPDELEAFREAGIDGVLTKPIRLRTVAEAIETHCPGRGRQDGTGHRAAARDDAALARPRAAMSP
jgi:PAS domain S-box-containing protein